MVEEHDVKQEFCKRLRRRREELGITRKEFASAVGVSVAAVGLYETGDRLPALPVLIQIAYVLHTSIDDLVGCEVDALPEYDRCKTYLESIGASVKECDGGQVDVWPVDSPSKKVHPVPLFGGKDVLVSFMREVKRNAGKKSKTILKQETLDALSHREKLFFLFAKVEKIGDELPDDAFGTRGANETKAAKSLFIWNVLQFVADAFEIKLPTLNYADGFQLSDESDNG